MTSSITRSSRSSVKKTNHGGATAGFVTMDNAITKSKSSATTNANKKTKKQLQKHKKDADLENRSQQQQEQQPHQQQQSQTDSMMNKIDASEHPEYIRLMSQLDQSKNERLQKVENWRNFERQSIHDWFAAQKKQAWDDFYFARKKVRSDLVQEVQQKIIRLKQELTSLNKQSKTQQLSEAQQECYDEDWVPPERLATIGLRSFVGGATNDEIDRDLIYARQPYNGNNTPNLVYSDYESRSTSDAAEDNHEVAASPTRSEMMQYSPSTISNNNHITELHHQQQNYQQPSRNYQYTTNDNQHHHNYRSISSAFGHHDYQQLPRLPLPTQLPQPEYTTGTASPNPITANNSNNNSNIYPPFEFEEMPQERRRDWWSYRSTTTA